MSLEELYQDLILDHHRHPRKRGVLADPDAVVTLKNPLCGDTISLSIASDGTRLAEVAFEGQGCSLSQASASMMAEACSGIPLTEVARAIAEFRRMIRGELTLEQSPILKDAVALQGVRKFHARMRCVLLAWDALENCLSQLPAAKRSPNA